MPAWRESLPQQSDVIDIVRSASIIRSPMDVGPAKVRLRSTKIVEGFTLQLIFTQQQLEEFINFWDIDLAGGVGTFTWEHPFTDQPCTCRMVTGFPDITLIKPGEAQDRAYSLRLAVEIV